MCDSLSSNLLRSQRDARLSALAVGNMSPNNLELISNKNTVYIFQKPQE